MDTADAVEPLSGGPIAVNSSRVQKSQRQQAACLPCRETKQKCSKGVPCQRCVANQSDCRYPLKSNRGRKRGSTNKPDTAEKIISRLSKSSFRDEVVAALGGSVGNDGSTSGSPMPPTPPVNSPQPLRRSMSQLQNNNASIGYLDCHQPTYSPLEILAAAVAMKKKQPSLADTAPSDDARHRTDMLQPSLPVTTNTTQTSSESLASDKMVELYFTPRHLDQTDWEILALQPADSTLQLQSTLHDPINSRLVDSEDAMLYFDLFYKYRNPLVGLLDPILHSPQFVRSASFTLFSVICALGCAMSERARDKLLCSALIALAEGNIKWSIAASVRTVETVQAIINMTYWAPLSERQCDDPYWLRLTHAAQIGREMGLHQPEVVAQKVDAIPGLCGEGRERRQRNYERVWLGIFIADKSFGIATGRPICVSWRELMPDVGDWWRKKWAAPYDRLLCGIAEMRLIVVKAFEARQTASRSKVSILQWQIETFDAVSHLRNSRCSYVEHSTSSKAPVNPILSFYLDYSMVLVNSYALRDLVGLGIADDLAELTTIYQRSIEIVDRMMDLILFDPVMSKLTLGMINPQLVMLCHVATEVTQAAKRGTLHNAVAQAAMKLRMLVNSLDNVKRALPSTSWVALYTTLYKTLIVQLDQVLASDTAPADNDFDDEALTGWWDPVGGGLLDLSNWLDSEAPGLDAAG
ncbi:hypothetical protein MBLNU13_g07607t1 [Cladosporium sp. NU13]